MTIARRSRCGAIGGARTRYCAGDAAGESGAGPPRNSSAAARRLAVLVISALLAASFLAPAARGAPAPASQVNFSISGLFPGYGPHITDYVVRCDDAPVMVSAHVPTVADVHRRVRSAGQRLQPDGPAQRREDLHGHGPPGRELPGLPYHVRCLPSGFPTYSFTRNGPVSPEYFAADKGFAPLRTATR